MADHLRPPRPGDPIEARPLRRFLERANALAKLRVTGSVGPERMDAKLSGTGAPYTCTEQAGTASGGWSDRAGGRVVPCYEPNAQTGLAGKVVPAWRDAAGVWRFEYARTGVAYIGPPSTHCSPCDIPQVDLHLSWTYLDKDGTLVTRTLVLAWNSGTLVWGPTSLIASNYCDPFVSNPIDGPCVMSCPSAGHSFKFRCDVSGFAQLDHGFQCGSGSTSTISYSMSTSTYSCGPFSADWAAGALLYRDRRLILTT